MASPAIISLPCGCFFQGRELITAENCGEHHEDEETACCDTCGASFLLDHLDSKPTINSRLRRIRAREGQLVMLRRAADLGFDFNRMECRRCYGPGFLHALGG